MPRTATATGEQLAAAEPHGIEPELDTLLTTAATEFMKPFETTELYDTPHIFHLLPFPKIY